MAMQKISPAEWGKDAFEAIGKQWFLLTAGTAEAGWNCMRITAPSTCTWWTRNCSGTRNSRRSKGFSCQRI